MVLVLLANIPFGKMITKRERVCLMNRNLFLFMVFGTPFFTGLTLLLIDRWFQVQWFNSKEHMALMICVYLPLITILRSRYLKISLKEFLLSVIPIFGSSRQLRLFRKP